MHRHTMTLTCKALSLVTSTDAISNLVVVIATEVQSTTKEQGMLNQPVIDFRSTGSCSPAQVPRCPDAQVPRCPGADAGAGGNIVTCGRCTSALQRSLIPRISISTAPSPQPCLYLHISSLYLSTINTPSKGHPIIFLATQEHDTKQNKR